MKVIKVSAGLPKYRELLLRQTPEMKGIWGDCKFLINSDVDKCDWWFVLHGSGIVNTEECLCDPNHIVYVSMEPSENMSRVSKIFLDQFSHLIICDRDIDHPNISYMNWLTWWVGIVVNKAHGKHIFSPNHNIDYNQLSMMQPMVKRNKISIVLSDKDFSKGHKKRIKFINKIINSPISKYVDVYGHGYNPIPDKWDAIAPYKYHLVLENSTQKDYWSEKLGDAFLGFSFPIYYGCPNILDYFSKDSLCVINIDEVDRSIEIIQSIIENNLYDISLDAINIARDQILNQYNVFNLMANLATNNASQFKMIKLRTNTFFSDSFIKRIIRPLINKINF